MQTVLLLAQRVAVAIFVLVATVVIARWREPGTLALLVGFWVLLLIPSSAEVVRRWFLGIGYREDYLASSVGFAIAAVGIIFYLAF